VQGAEEAASQPFFGTQGGVRLNVSANTRHAPIWPAWALVKKIVSRRRKVSCSFLKA
jgi:hypothetical protein